MAIFVIFCVVLLSENKYDDDEPLKILHISLQISEIFRQCYSTANFNIFATLLKVSF